MVPKRRTPAVILLAEDSPADQELALRAIEKVTIPRGLRIVEDGEEAPAYLFHRGKYKPPASSSKPDLLLLDLILPRVNGYQVLKEIRADSKLRPMPELMLTTSPQEKDILRSYEPGCNCFFAKRAGLDQVIGLIQAIEKYWFETAFLPPKTE
jgi:two-component system response regulator